MNLSGLRSYSVPFFSSSVLCLFLPAMAFAEPHFIQDRIEAAGALAEERSRQHEEREREAHERYLRDLHTRADTGIAQGDMATLNSFITFLRNNDETRRGLGISDSDWEALLELEGEVGVDGLAHALGAAAMRSRPTKVGVFVFLTIAGYEVVGLYRDSAGDGFLVRMKNYFFPPERLGIDPRVLLTHEALNNIERRGGTAVVRENRVFVPDNDGNSFGVTFSFDRGGRLVVERYSEPLEVIHGEMIFQVAPGLRLR